jgi:hypothetical protein
MNPQNKITQLEDWLKKFPADHPMRPVIEADLRKAKESQIDRPIERDTFDLREHNFHSI